MAPVRAPSICTPLRGRLLWSLDDASVVTWAPDRVRFSRHDDVTAREISRADWMTEVVERLALGPVDLGHIPGLAEDNASWVGQRAPRPDALWPKVRRLIDDLGWHITPWYQPPAATTPLLALPGARTDPVPFALPEIDLGSSRYRFPSALSFEAAGTATVISAPGLSRSAWVGSPRSAEALRDWWQTGSAIPVLELDAPLIDIVRCLAGAGLLTAEQSRA